MTCQECQLLAIDLARGLPPFDVGGAVQRADVLSHIATCKQCAQWSKVQEALSDALRAAAAADASLSAPARIEANVMAAFRARQARRPAHLQGPAHVQGPSHVHRPAVTFVRPEPVVDAEQPEQLARAWRPAWLAGRAAVLAAAAAIVIATLTTASWRWLSPAPVVESGGRSSAAASASAPREPEEARVGGPTASSPSASSPAASSPAVTGTNAAVIEVLPDKGKKTPKGPPAPPRAAVVARGANEFSEPAFVLLPYVEPLRPTEMRHIMRVRMTRTQLEASELRASGVDDATVLADVLVGEDGTARAVRIVQ